MLVRVGPALHAANPACEAAYKLACSWRAARYKRLALRRPLEQALAQGSCAKSAMTALLPAEMPAAL